MELPLRVDVGHKHRTAIDAKRGKPAVTHLRVLERLGPLPWSRRRLRPGAPTRSAPTWRGWGTRCWRTSYTAAARGRITHPAWRGLGLHAFQLEIEHPVQHTRLHFEAPYPEDFVQALDYLRQLGRVVPAVG